MPPTVERVGDDLLYRISAGGSVIFTDEIGTELFRVSSVGDAVSVSKAAINPAALGVVSSLEGLTATAAELNALDVSAASVARTATADGLTTGTIAAAGLIQYIAVTAGSDANAIIVLPPPAPGTIVVLNIGATGFELRTTSPTTIAINGGTGAAAESAIPANSTVVAICISATAWKAIFLDADSDVAKVEAAAT